MLQWNAANVISSSSGFSKSSLNIWKFTVHVLLKPIWSLAWRILIITLLACEMSEIMQWFEHSLTLPFFGIEMKIDLSQVCGHSWVFQICWHIECSTLTASFFTIWNGSAGIPSPPLALFIVLLPKAHLASHCSISGSRWVITSSWLFGSLRLFLYSSVYFCHLS